MMGLRVQVQLMSIGMPGGSAHEGVCIAAGVSAEGGCEWRKENRVHGDMTPAASPRTSEGPQKHAMVFQSRHVYFEHKRIKNHQYQ
jgi:hypothetical protein